MSESIFSRGWLAPVPVSGDFTDEQKQRVQALRAASEILRRAIPDTERRAPLDIDDRTYSLIQLAGLILDGEVPLRSATGDDEMDLTDDEREALGYIEGGFVLDAHACEAKGEHVGSTRHTFGDCPLLPR